MQIYSLELDRKTTFKPLRFFSSEFILPWPEEIERLGNCQPSSTAEPTWSVVTKPCRRLSFCFRGSESRPLLKIIPVALCVRFGRTGSRMDPRFLLTWVVLWTGVTSRGMYTNYALLFIGTDPYAFSGM